MGIQLYLLVYNFIFSVHNCTRSIKLGPTLPVSPGKSARFDWTFRILSWVSKVLLPLKDRLGRSIKLGLDDLLRLTGRVFSSNYQLLPLPLFHAHVRS